MTMTTLLTVQAAWDRGDMMDGDRAGWHWVGMALVFLFLVGFLAAVVVLVMRQSRSAQPAPAQPAQVQPPTDSAHRILAERLARGEITPDEYTERAQVLDRRSAPGT